MHTLLVYSDRAFESKALDKTARIGVACIVARLDHIDSERPSRKDVIDDARQRL